jgi:Sec-independent protein translocase protein TatA
MDFLGVGPMELFFVVILALIILGPKDMQKAGRTMGRWMNNLVKSDTWKLVRQASNKIKYLPNELMREAGLDEIKKTSQAINKEVGKEISQEFEDPFKAWREQHPSATIEKDNSSSSENKIDPPQTGYVDGEEKDA